MYPTAVVVELGVNGLGIIRSLGKKGVPVIGVDSKKSNYGALSRYCKTVFCKDVNDRHLIDTLIRIGKSLGEKAVLFCSSDLPLLVVSKYRNELQSFFSFVLPDDDVVKGFLSKRQFYEFAVEKQFSVPKTFFSNNRKEVEKIAKFLSFPCIIKPEIRDEYWYRHVPLKNKVLFASSIDEYFKLFDMYGISQRPVIIQEWIHGNDRDVYFCLTYIDRNYKPLALFTGRKIRQYPTLTGCTSVAVSYREPFIESESIRLLKMGNCRGICGVEFKFCNDEKIYKITEPTVGRTDLQEAISTKSGIDIPYIAYLDAIGNAPKSSKNYKVGTKWINEPYDIYRVSRLLKEKKYTILDVLLSYKGRRTYALMDIRDLRPFLFFLFETLKNLLKKIRKSTT